MKQFITLLSVIGIMTSCRNTPEPSIGAASNTMVTEERAAEFAAFEAWKKDKEKESEMAATKLQAQPVKETITKVIYVPLKANRAATRTVVNQPEPVAQPVPVVTQTPEKPVAKKGWSKAAKGAVIGAGAGAVAGAVISKNNRVLGAVIGGVAGGGVGYGIGRGMDKRDGRY